MSHIETKEETESSEDSTPPEGACETCQKNQAKAGFRITTERATNFVLIVDGDFEEENIDLEVIEEEEELLCFACFKSKYGEAHLRDVPRAELRDEPIE